MGIKNVLVKVAKNLSMLCSLQPRTILKIRWTTEKSQAKIRGGGNFKTGKQVGFSVGIYLSVCDWVLQYTPGCPGPCNVHKGGLNLHFPSALPASITIPRFQCFAVR